MRIELVTANYPRAPVFVNISQLKKNNLVTKAYHMGIVGKFKWEYTSVLDWGILSFTPFLKLK